MSANGETAEGYIVDKLENKSRESIGKNQENIKETVNSAENIEHDKSEKDELHNNSAEIKEKSTGSKDNVDTTAVKGDELKPQVQRDEKTTYEFKVTPEGTQETFTYQEQFVVVNTGEDEGEDHGEGELEEVREEPEEGEKVEEGERGEEDEKVEGERGEEDEKEEEGERGEEDEKGEEGEKGKDEKGEDEKGEKDKKGEEGEKGEKEEGEEEGQAEDFVQQSGEEKSAFDKQAGRDVRFQRPSEFSTMVDDNISAAVDYGDEVSDVYKEDEYEDGDDFSIIEPAVKEEEPISEGTFGETEEQKYEKKEAEMTTESVEEVTVNKIDRGYYYELNEKLLKVLNFEKLTNNCLQMKVATYYKKRRMEHVFKEDAQLEHNLEKYERKLESLDGLSKVDEQQRKELSSQIVQLQIERDSKSKTAEDLFKRLQKEEFEITKGMTFAKSGNPLSDKAVENMLKKQKKVMELLKSCRITYFKLKLKMRKKQDVLRSLDDIGSHLHLIDYEQLKEDNKNHTDKLDERESELSKFRTRCHDVMQMMAHIREKSSFLSLDLATLNDRLSDVNNDLSQARMHLAFIKNNRDNYRLMIHKLKENTALIMSRTILLDIRETDEKIEEANIQLAVMKEDFEKKCDMISNLKKHVEILEKAKDLSKKKERSGPFIFKKKTNTG